MQALLLASTERGAGVCARTSSCVLPNNHPGNAKVRESQCNGVAGMAGVQKVAQSGHASQ